MKRDRLKDGELLFGKDFFIINCCDCGLRHLITVKKVLKVKKGMSTLGVNDQEIALGFYKDNEGTEINRKIFGDRFKLLKAKKKRGITIKDKVVKRGKAKKKKPPSKKIR